MENLILKVEDLKVWFDKDNFVLEGINFQIRKNEVFSLVGESGSGKTLTCLSICKLLPFQANYSGRVWFYQENKKINLLELSEGKIRKFRGRRISYIFQESLASLNPFLRIGFQIEEVLIFNKGLSKREAKLKTLKLLEGVQILNPKRLYSSFPHQISGGEAQRVMIAMALAAEPEILICDEPTSNLDITIQMQIIELLNKKKQQFGLSILFVTHDLSLVESFSDRVAILNKGRIVEEGVKNEIFNNPKEEYTKELIHSCFKLA